MVNNSVCNIYVIIVETIVISDLHLIKFALGKLNLLLFA